MILSSGGHRSLMGSLEAQVKTAPGSAANAESRGLTRHFDLDEGGLYVMVGQTQASREDSGGIR